MIVITGLTIHSGIKAQTVRRVPSEYPTIKAAMDSSVDGDVVLVAPGTYFEALDFLDREIELRSEEGPEVTIIDALFKNTVITFGANLTRQAVLEGFTLTNGLTQETFRAGGIHIDYQSSPVIRGNIIRNNLGSAIGNGISLVSAASPLIERNRIIQNTNGPVASGGGGGGGIGVMGYNCGGPGVECGAEIVGNYIAFNTTQNFLSGGGIYSNGGGALRIVGNVFEGNTAPYSGGAISFSNGTRAVIENNLMIGNEAGSHGGAVAWLVPSGERGPFMIGNTLVNNRAPAGSAAFLDGFDIATRFINNLVVSDTDNTVVHCGDFNDPYSPIIRHNNVYTTSGVAFAGLCEGSVGVDSNISEPPLFVGPDNYRLAKGSPGIDAGANAFVGTADDLDGFPRIADGDHDGEAIVDMGAYERDTLFEDGFEI